MSKSGKGRSIMRSLTINGWSHGYHFKNYDLKEATSAKDALVKEIKRLNKEIEMRVDQLASVSDYAEHLSYYEGIESIPDFAESRYDLKKALSALLNHISERDQELNSDDVEWDAIANAKEVIAKEAQS